MTSESSPWIGCVQALLALSGTWLLAFGLKSTREARGFDTSRPHQQSWRFWGGLTLVTLAAMPTLMSPFVRVAPPAVSVPQVERPRPVTGAELFELRGKCVQLGEKLMAANLVGSALTQSQVSHFSPRTNRCYVDLNVHMADLDKFDEYNARHLYDGQTGELLASISHKKGKTTTYLKDGVNTEENVIARLESLMAEE